MRGKCRVYGEHFLFFVLFLLSPERNFFDKNDFSQILTVPFAKLFKSAQLIGVCKRTLRNYGIFICQALLCCLEKYNAKSREQVKNLRINIINFSNIFSM